MRRKWLATTVLVLLAHHRVSAQFTGSPAQPVRAGDAPVTHNNIASQQPAAADGSSPTLTLVEAEQRALQHQPRLLAQRLREQAAKRVTSENRSAYFPQIAGSLTAVEANGDTAIAAGAVSTSSISTRAAGGLTLLQLLTDFGRTHDLVRSASLSADASGQRSESMRQQIVRDVDEAYFAAQAAESVRRTAQAVLEFRRVSLRQLTALAESQLKSTLDVQFAQVLVSEAELAVVRADSAVDESRAQLTAAMGDESDPDYALTDHTPLLALDGNVSTYVDAALQSRPDLRALKLQAKAAHEFAQAEKKLNYPTVNALGAAGEVPIHDSTLHHDYGAIGVNLNVPVFNGGLYFERASDAKLRAQAADEDAAEVAVEVSREVKTAWARARDAYLQIQVAQRLVDQTNEAMRLAQAQYNAGLGSIVELNEAELNQTSALITAASAQFDYLRARTELDFSMGNVH